MSNEILTFHWDDLDDHFGEEKDIIEVDSSITLEEVATAFDKKNMATIHRLLGNNLLREISDETANAWFDNNQRLHGLETSEWILLQIANSTTE